MTDITTPADITAYQYARLGRWVAAILGRAEEWDSSLLEGINETGMIYGLPDLSNTGFWAQDIPLVRPSEAGYTEHRGVEVEILTGYDAEADGPNEAETIVQIDTGDAPDGQVIAIMLNDHTLWRGDPEKG